MHYLEGVCPLYIMSHDQGYWNVMWNSLHHGFGLRIVAMRKSWFIFSRRLVTNVKDAISTQPTPFTLKSWKNKNLSLGVEASSQVTQAFNDPLSNGHWVIKITNIHFIHAGLKRGPKLLSIFTQACSLNSTYTWTFIFLQTLKRLNGHHDGLCPLKCLRHASQAKDLPLSLGTKHENELVLAWHYFFGSFMNSNPKKKLDLTWETKA